MTQHITYSFASRNRPDKFREAINNIFDQSANTKFSIIAKIDNNDPAFNQYHDIIFNWKFETGCRCAVIDGSSDSKVHAINRGISEYINGILICMSDDMRFITPGFDNIIRQHCGPDNFVHFPDGHVNRRLSTMSIMGEQYYRRFGYIYHPSYKSLWCDNEAMLVAQRLGRYKYVRQQIFEHQHPAWGFGEKDELLTYTESFHEEDKANFIKRKRAGFPI